LLNLREILYTMPLARHSCRADPETIRAASLGPHPSAGGSSGYNIQVRQMAMNLQFNGENEDDLIDGLRQHRLYPSERTG
jgi:hypothetical protein